MPRTFGPGYSDTLQNQLPSTAPEGAPVARGNIEREKESLTSGPRFTSSYGLSRGTLPLIRGRYHEGT